MAQNRRGGIIFLSVNGETQNAKGNFTYNFGEEKRETIVGADEVHGYKAVPQEAMISGAITDRGTLDVRALLRLDNATVTLLLANGKQCSLAEAWYAGDGNITTEEGEIEVKFVGLSSDEVT